MSNKCCSRDGEGRKNEGGGGGSRSKIKLCVCVTKLCVCDKVVCERWCVTKKDGGVWQSCVCERWCVCVCESCVCVWKRACDKVVCERMVCESCLWKRACDKVVCERWRVTKLCVWKRACDKIVLKDAKVAAEEPDEEAAGYRIKNKNLTQRCGEKTTPQNETTFFSRDFPHFFETIWVSNIRERGIPTFEAPPAARCDSHNRPWSGGWASRSYISHIKSNIYKY